MTKCCRSILSRVSHEPLIAEARSRNRGDIRNEPIIALLSNRIDAIFPSWDDRCIIGVMVEAEVVHSDSNKQLIDTLRRSKLFRRYEQVFSEATGLPLTLRPADYWQLEHDGKKHQNRFCAMLAERPATLAVCLQAHQDIIDHTGLIPHTVTCPFGLTETAIPVTLGAKIIGYLRIGRCCVTRRRNRTAQKSAANWSGTECDSRARFAKHGRKLRSFHQTNTMPPCDCSHFSPNNSPDWLIKSWWNRTMQSRLLF